MKFFIRSIVAALVAAFITAPAWAADDVFNIAKGRFVELHNRISTNDPAPSALILIILEANEADATLIDYDDIGTLLGAAGNTEATAGCYARVTLTDTELGAFPAPDDTNDRYDVDAPDQTFSACSGNNFTKALLAYDADTGAGTDSNLLPVAFYDFAVTLDGSDVTLQFNAAGYARAQ